MALETLATRGVDVPAHLSGLGIIDCDVHNSAGDRLLDFLPSRWRRYVELVGRRNSVPPYGATSLQRPGACRIDAFPADGGPAGSNPDLAREQLLDEYGMTAGVLNTLDWLGGGNAPVDYEVAAARATNDVNAEVWLASDPRWRAAIIVAPDHPQQAADEIVRCREMSDRFVQVFIGSRTERPAGNPMYWPIYEAAAEHGLPIAFHVGSTKYHGWSGIGTGVSTFYYETHVGFPLAAQALTSSLIFEGVFERFPELKIVETELGWEWAVPFSWRMDATWSVQREEVPHLRRRPSEYFRDHFWFSTQPAVEPEDPAQITSLLEQFTGAGFGDRLMFATDYPHWDMDSPFEAMPVVFPQDVTRRIMGETGSRLYGIPLDDGGER